MTLPACAAYDALFGGTSVRRPGRGFRREEDRKLESFVGLVLLVLLGLWALGLIRRIGGCLIHLLLLVAGLVLAGYLLAAVLGR